MDAVSVAASSSSILPTKPRTRSGPVDGPKPGQLEPVDPKEWADRQRADNDRKETEQRVAEERERSAAGPGIGRQVDVTA